MVNQNSLKASILQEIAWDLFLLSKPKHGLKYNKGNKGGHKKNVSSHGEKSQFFRI